MKRHMLYFSGVFLFLLGLLVISQATDLNPLLGVTYYREHIFNHLYVLHGPGIKYDLLFVFLYLGIGVAICVLAYKIIRRQVKLVS